MGHLNRSAEIVGALSRRFKVLFVTGGEPVSSVRVLDYVELLQLPPLRADPEFKIQRITGNCRTVPP
jgi:predicted glycosyltransferase